MKQQTALAIVLRRTNYGEADRVITFLTPAGKVRALVKGVRRSNSKLAGGIELFSESSITFMETRGELARIISTRLNVHWDGFVGDLQRMMFGYEAMKLIDKVVEDEAEANYYELLKNTLSALAEMEIPLTAVELWYYLHLLKLMGHMPNIKTDHTGKALQDDTLYNFSTEDMCFSTAGKGSYRSEHIKLLRLVLSQPPSVLKKVKNIQTLAEPLTRLFKNIIQTLV